MNDESLENNIVSLSSRGWSVRRLAREFVISRGRVRRLLYHHAAGREKGTGKIEKPATASSKLDLYKPFITELLEKYKNPPITNQRIFELIKERGYQGGLTIVRDYIVTVRTKKTPEPIVCVETAPGERGSHDWSEYFISFTLTGVEKVTFLSFILNYSRRQYIELVEDKSQPTLLRGLMNAFSYLEGVPREIKSDNQKACVDRWELGRPVFNRTYLGFCTHYRTVPLTIHPGKPTENLKIERPFYYLEMSFLNGREFRDPEDLKKQLSLWLTQYNDVRIHRTTGRKPIEMHVEELPFLHPLPPSPYDASTVEYRVVNNESCIQWDGYYYAVPRGYLYESCPVRADDKQLTIYSPLCHPLVSHPLAEKGRKDRYIGRTSRPVQPRIDAAALSVRLEAFGAPMQQYIAEVKRYNPSSYLHHWKHLLSLKVHYHVEDILAAVRRASKHHVYQTQAVENFLKINAGLQDFTHKPF